MKPVHHLNASETVLGDDYEVHAGYVYIADGVFARCERSGTVGEWRRRFGLSEVRRCDLFGHEWAMLGDRVQP